MKLKLIYLLLLTGIFFIFPKPSHAVIENSAYCREKATQCINGTPANFQNIPQSDGCHLTYCYTDANGSHHYWCEPLGSLPGYINGGQNPQCPAGSDCNDGNAVIKGCQFCGNWNKFWKIASPTPAPACGDNCEDNPNKCTDLPNCNVCAKQSASGPKVCQSGKAVCGGYCDAQVQCPGDGLCPCTNNVCTQPPPPPATKYTCVSSQCVPVSDCNNLPGGASGCYSSNSCENQCAPAATQTPIPSTPPPSNTPSPTTPVTNTPTATPNPVCTVGQQCSNCNGNPGTCYPDCNGGWCNGQQCSSCAPLPPPKPPVNTPTPVQATSQISMPATPTINPTRVPTGTSSGLPKLAQRWVCLNAQPCSNPATGCTVQGDHRVKLSIKTDKGDDARPLANKDTYIFECLQTTSGTKCTTGDEETDKRAVSSSILPAIAQAPPAGYGYTFGGIYFRDGSPVQNPIDRQYNSNGDIGTYEWESYTETTVNRLFLAMNEFIPSGIEGEHTTQQQGTIPSGEGTSKKCIQIKWDPAGKVIDQSTGKPVIGAQVYLFKKDKTGKYDLVTSIDVLGGIVNPLTTDQDGDYNFMVPDGVYRLEVKKTGYEEYKSKDLNEENGQMQQYNIDLVPVNSSFIEKIKYNLKNFLQ